MMRLASRLFPLKLLGLLLLQATALKPQPWIGVELLQSALVHLLPQQVT